MALVSCNLFKSSVVQKISSLNCNACTVLAQNFSSVKKGRNEPVTKDESEIKKSVFISQSNNIFTNLAIEDWIYQNMDFNKHHILLIWRNAPCVVIGRHQNPWLEANMKYLGEKGIDIARRNSGGGTVYHDKGNLNLTFFTPRERYDRKKNLETITKALFREFSLKIDISDREDLLYNNYYKISGTASKLGRPNAYHHCTLLVDADKTNVRSSLQKNNDEIETNATRSVPSPTRNLREVNYRVKNDRLLSALGWEYLRTTAISNEDGGQEQIAKQRGFQFINPTDKWFPGLNEIREGFVSWDWRFGKTPKFEAGRNIPMYFDLSEKNNYADMRLSVNVDQGKISDVALRLPPDGNNILSPNSDIISSVRGKKYSSETLDVLEKSLVFVEKKEDAKAALRA
ncbi:UNVERIFIED_CONTAM: hypothetical protein PYX00_010307 [Menopon gallinae]|uniref:BPL/LPL catalytic domain-containing protein n=1 Tax=Menopon gallinae TaxID=328185 RepID=A0AAW2HF35_9NEOP